MALAKFQVYIIRLSIRQSWLVLPDLNHVLLYYVSEFEVHGYEIVHAPNTQYECEVYI